MAQVINTNIMSLNAQRNLGTSGASLATTIQRLSSGLRINSAKDDAAGLAISERFTTQIRGLDVASRNANDGISLAQTAEGAMTEIGNNLQRIRELAVQSANATNSDTDRAALQAEVTQLVSEIDRVATQTEFNGTKLLDGSFGSKSFQIGANAGQTIAISGIANARTSALGQYQGVNALDKGIGTASDTAAAKSINVGGTDYDLGTIANDAAAIAAAITSKGIAGMQVTANAAKVSGTSGAAGTAGDADSVQINGVNINLTNTGDAASNRANAMAQINAQSSRTGVRAVDNGSGLDLIADDGRNITTAFTAGDAATSASYGIAADATTGGTLNINYAAPSNVNGTMAFTGFTVGGDASVAISDTGTAVSAFDISDVKGAEAVMRSVDAALQTINSSRADLGAVQNRFTSVVANLQTSSENLSASRSRIRDTDYAKETAELTRTQILQQAGTAMLAQANSSSQSVLSLLQ
ncbi:flagellin [Stenotrophomonas sp. ESTM1D_MKCIP4_1]|uniref:flagellin n=1 Tax=Stenotrophomonas sp. ESTM1D_MKCIP4_1 TaxID=2072414 RepID=UPI000D53DFDA|nr:flagellin [Stenotrophomonas sp. ESTM1D_MKCIP4_1]AWH53450.1 flagellin [Stenotrophomonas sp. ESTM1D_MKCIP4_1]